MKTLEFESRLNGDEDDEWRSMSAAHFAESYAAEDSVYEQLLSEPPARPARTPAPQDGVPRHVGVVL